MTDIYNGKELLLRLAQALKEEITAYSDKKAATNVHPYAKRYNLLRERAISLGIADADKLIPELSSEVLEYHFTVHYSDSAQHNITAFDEVEVAICQMVAYLEVIQQESIKVLSELEEFLFKNLRKNVISQPIEEKDIQNIIEIMLNSKSYAFEREKVRITYSSKTFIPDFTFEDLKAALEIKFCKADKKEKDLVDEINADILAYQTKYQNLTFLIYDMGIIRDIDRFSKDIEKNTPRIKVLVVKQ